MFDNWDVVRAFLIDKIGFTNEITLTLSQAKIDMLSVFMKERGVISLKDTICSPEKLGDMLLFKENLVTAEEVSSALCQLEDSQTQNITITLMKNLNFDYIFKNVNSYLFINRHLDFRMLQEFRRNVPLPVSVNER